MKKKLFLNADVGEGMRNDKELMPYLTYANIACGGHFGTDETIFNTLQLAKKNDVKVGAHPSYPDPENFGRKSLQISREELAKTLKKQIDQFIEQCELIPIKMNHIKLHGALYNDVFGSKEFTLWFISFIKENYPKTLVFIPVFAESFITEVEKRIVLIEAFADRNYNNDLTLVSRSNSKAILGSIKKIKEHVLFISKGEIKTIEEEKKQCEADTLCVHGDHPLALKIAKELRELVL